MKSGSNSNPKVKYKCRTLNCFVLNWYRIYFGLKYCWVYMVFWLYAVCSHSVTAAAVTAAVCKSDRRLTQLFCTNYLFHSMWHFVKRHTITQKYQRKIKSWNHWTLQKSPPQWKSQIAAQKKNSRFVTRFQAFYWIDSCIVDIQHLLRCESQPNLTLTKMHTHICLHKFCAPFIVRQMIQ